MVIDGSLPIWFIYLRTRRPYLFSGFFTQVGNRFQPVMLLNKSSKFTMASILSKVASGIIERREQGAYFHIDGTEVARIPFSFKENRARADVWIDNAVYEIRKGDPAGVYRHATQENRKTSLLELDYVKVY